MSQVAASIRAPIRRHGTFWPLAGIGLCFVACAALTIGRYPISVAQVISILADHVLPGYGSYSLTDARVVEWVRLPRVLMAMIAGGGLGLAGAALQSLFRNPLVGPDMIGIAPGAAFGGALAIMIPGAAWLTVGSAFAGGLAAIFIVLAFARASGRTGTLTLVLAGVVVGALFVALVSLIKFLANVESQLPAITYWLLGSFAGANYGKLAILTVAVLLGGAPLIGLRFHLNVMALGEDEAAALGLKVSTIRSIVLIGATFIVAASVAVAGVIGWIGLVVPHLV